jgi:preprotein translocase subunit SecY
VSLATGFGGGGFTPSGRSDKGLSLPLSETFRLAWADPELRQRILFVLGMFAVYALGVHVPVPVPGFDSRSVAEQLKGVPMFEYLNVFGGGALQRLSIFALGLNPYITASIIMQILQSAIPQWKKEMQEGGEYARKQNNKRTRMLSLFLCVAQGWGLLQIMRGAPSIAAIPMGYQLTIILFWTAGSMFMLWLGEQISEKGIGNGVSLMIFAGIIISLPGLATDLARGVRNGVVSPFSVVAVLLIFLAATWFIVYFTTAQRRIPIQHMRRTIGTRQVGGNTSYLPLSVNMAGVLPIIFAVSLVGLPSQFSALFGERTTPLGNFFYELSTFLIPSNPAGIMPGVPVLENIPRGVIGSIAYTLLIFFFTYFWTALQYNVEDISNNLKRGGSFIPGVRPGKQTKDFLDGVITRVTFVGAAFIAAVALLQYIAPAIARIPFQYVSIIGGTSLLIIVSVALETMRQIEANLLMKQYGQQ